jgi:hypothetical protein
MKEKGSCSAERLGWAVTGWSHSAHPCCAGVSMFLRILGVRGVGSAWPLSGCVCCQFSLRHFLPSATSPYCSERIVCVVLCTCLHAPCCLPGSCCLDAFVCCSQQCHCVYVDRGSGLSGEPQRLRFPISIGALARCMGSGVTLV